MMWRPASHWPYCLYRSIIAGRFCLKGTSSSLPAILVETSCHCLTQSQTGRHQQYQHKTKTSRPIYILQYKYGDLLYGWPLIAITLQQVTQTRPALTYNRLFNLVRGIVVISLLELANVSKSASATEHLIYLLNFTYIRFELLTSQ